MNNEGRKGSHGGHGGHGVAEYVLQCLQSFYPMAPVIGLNHETPGNRWKSVSAV
jgi:hypothetical protein